MTRRMGSRTFVGAGAALLGLALFGYFAAGDAEEDQGGFAIPEPYAELSCPPRQPQEVVFRFVNGSRLPARIVGLAEC